MKGKLEEVLQGNELIVLDTSATDFHGDYSIHGQLSRRFDGLDRLNEEIVGAQIERGRIIQDIAQTGRLVVIKEVFDEMNADLTFINNQINYLNSNPKGKYYTEKINLVREYAWEKSRLMKKLGRRDLRLGLESTSENYLKILNNTVSNQDAIFTRGLFPEYKQTLDRLKFEKPDLLCLREITENSFGGKHEVNFPMYSGFLSWALFHAQGNKRLAIEKALTKRNPGCQGLFLDTDSKIVAAAMSLSYKAPVKVITRDEGLSKVFAGVSKEAKEKLGNAVPRQYSIDLFFPWQPYNYQPKASEEVVV